MMDLQEKELENFLTFEGYYDIKLLGDNRVGLRDYLYTCSIVVGLSEVSYEGRYCYSSHKEASSSLSMWDGKDDPPGKWIKYKGRGGERLGPWATDGI